MMIFVVVVGYEDTFYGAYSTEELANAAVKEYDGEWFEVKCVELDQLG